MTWTYDPGVMADRDKLRLAIGDTNEDDQQFTDEEIAYLLTANGSLFGAAAAACEMLAARYARYADKWVGDLKILASQKSRAYLDQAKIFRTKGAVYGIPTAGGIYVAEKETNEDNDALVHPSFTTGMMANTEE